MNFGKQLNPTPMTNKEKTTDLRNKIMNGVKKAVEKVIKTSQANDEEIVISQNGKVVKIKARDLK
jgi:hypothetical protein